MNERALLVELRRARRMEILAITARMGAVSPNTPDHDLLLGLHRASVYALEALEARIETIKSTERAEAVFASR